MRKRCAFDGCGVGASRDGFCGSHAPDVELRQSLPMQPLVALVDARGGAKACGLEPGSPEYRYYFGAKQLGKVTPARADRLAHSVLGCHPCEVWGEWFGPYGVSV